MPQPETQPNANSATDPRCAFPAPVWAVLPPLIKTPSQAIEHDDRTGLVGLDIMEAWLIASRRMIDLWRQTIREQQDAMLTVWRSQLTGAKSACSADSIGTPEAPIPAARKASGKAS